MNTQPTQCRNCGNLNLPDANNCTNCGTVLKYKTTSLSPKTLITFLIVIAVPVLCCGICQLGKNDRQANSANSAVVATTSPSSTPATLFDNSSNTKKVNSNSSIENAANSSISQSKKSRMATVISENVNLRGSPDSNGTVIDEIPEGAELQVIRQKGAWFFVSYLGRSGWVHGNTIKLSENAEVLSDVSQTAPKNNSPRTQSTPNPPRTEPRIEKSNPSGATARCADGSLSYSASRRGTCSHHGGVAEWF